MCESNGNGHENISNAVTEKPTDEHKNGNSHSEEKKQNEDKPSLKTILIKSYNEQMYKENAEVCGESKSFLFIFRIQNFSRRKYEDRKEKGKY